VNTYQKVSFYNFFFLSQDKRITCFDPASYTPADIHCFLSLLDR